MELKRYSDWLILHDQMKRRNTWMSLPQSTGSLTTNTALTVSEETSYLGTVFRGWLLLSNPCLVVHFLYWARGSMFSKQDAYSSKDTTFLTWRINQAIWNVKKSWNLGKTKWLGHYRDLTWNHTQTLVQQVLLFQWQQWVDSHIWGEAKKQGRGGAQLTTPP